MRKAEHLAPQQKATMQMTTISAGDVLKLALHELIWGFVLPRY